MDVTITKPNLAKLRQGREITSQIAMTIVLISFAMLFMSMLLGYAVIRFSAIEWPPMGMESVDLMLPTVSTVIIAFSSFFYVLHEKNFRQTSLYLWLTFICGLGFMAIQTYFWNVLKAAGMYTSSGVFPSIIYGFTWIHAGHIVLALLFLGWLLFKGNRFKDETAQVLSNQNVGKFWHFLGFVWLVLYLTLFVF